MNSQETANHPNWTTSNDNFAAVLNQQHSDVDQLSVEEKVERCNMNGHKVLCRIDNNNRSHSPEYDSPEDDVYMEEEGE